MMLLEHSTHLVNEAVERVRRARELTDRQKDLVAKFESEGLDSFAERNLLNSFEDVLALEEVRLGRLLYEDSLVRARENRGAA